MPRLAVDTCFRREAVSSGETINPGKTLSTKVLSDSLGRIGSLKRISDKSLFPMNLGSCDHRITHQLRPINMNGRPILSVMSGKGNRMGILQRGLTPRLRPALLFLPFPVLLTVAIACFAQPKYENATPAIEDSLPANSSSPPQNEPSGARKGSRLESISNRRPRLRRKKMVIRLIPRAG